MVNNKQTTFVAIMALSAAHGSSAFVVNTPTHNTISRRPLFSTIEIDTMTSNNVDDVTAITSEASKLIMDIPPTPIAPQKKAPVFLQCLGCLTQPGDEQSVPAGQYFFVGDHRCSLVPGSEQGGSGLV